MPIAPNSPRQIVLTQGQHCWVDAEDYDNLIQYRWCAWYNSNNRSFYAKNRRVGYMSRFILGVTDSRIQVDHKNRNTLDNRKDNLRIATPAQNSQHKKMSKLPISGFRGVIERGKGRWQVRINASGVRHYLGCYRTPEEAALVYEAAALKYYGEFVCFD